MRRPLLIAAGVLVLLALALLLWRPWSPGGVGTGARTIVLVTPDTLRRDRVGVYGRNALTPTPLTPRLDQLAAQGLRFEDARTPVPLTLPAHTTMLAGRPPASTGVRLNAYGRLPDEATRGFPLLAERLRAAGWKTGAFVSAAPLLALHGLDQGFDRYDDDGLDVANPDLALQQRPGEETVDRALVWLRKQAPGARVFLWVHLFEPHAPYDLPPTVPTEVRYDGDVARCDRIVGRLLDGLAAADRGDAAVLVAADHGEALDELGERTHGYLLGDAVLRVPFLLRAPGLTPGLREDPVDLADVAPTLAGLAGVAWPAAPDGLPGAGRDLLAGPAPEDRVRVSETLYAKQRFGWAQLLGATNGQGGTLVDAGGERAYWLEAAPLGSPQGLPALARSRPEAAALAGVLRAYRQGERQDLMRGGGTAGGYGSGASAAPFLDPQANGRLPDPYARIGAVDAIQQLAQAVRVALRSQTPLKPLLARLERMDREDPTNPEIAYRRGWALSGLAARAASPEEAARLRAKAESTWLEAWRRGMRDANTLGLLVGVNAPGRQAQALARLDELAPQIPPDARLELLRARLLRALGHDEDAEAACERAVELGRRPWERKALERAREDGVCR